MYDITITPFDNVHDVDCVIVVVAHDDFRKLGIEKTENLYIKEFLRMRKSL